MKKSTNASVKRCNKIADEVLEKIPGSFIKVRAVTTSSIYMSMPDGFSIRIADHRGKEKYRYKYNLDPNDSAEGCWIRDRGVWRLYTSSVDVVAAAVARNVTFAALDKFLLGAYE